MSSLNKNILVVSGLYLPGWKGGGLIKTVVNLVENLKDEYNFYVLCGDRDLGDTMPYDNIQCNRWLERDGYNIMYLEEDGNNPKNIAGIINELNFQVLYLNSFFARFTVNILLAIRMKMIVPNRVIVAPKGEFGWGSFQQKITKKVAYIYIGILIGLFKNVIWHASSVHEKKDILKYLRVSNDRIKIAIDIPIIYREFSNIDKFENALEFSNRRPLKIVFLSRIVMEKNLLFCLELLREISLEIVFDVYGPKEDPEYWGKCNIAIDRLPSNIQFNYQGPVDPNSVQLTFKQYDLFFFPTLGENYGHVIAESLLAGTPVLTSDLTPWRNLQEKKMGWVYSLNERNRFIQLILDFARGRIEKDFYSRKSIRRAVLAHLASMGDLTQNRNLFIN